MRFTILNINLNVLRKLLQNTYHFLLDHYGYERDNNTQLQNDKDSVLSQLYSCDAVVIVEPEWGDMIPPALIYLLLCANDSYSGLTLGHKPAFTIGLSTSAGGSNPISLLKSYAAKNTHFRYQIQLFYLLTINKQQDLLCAFRFFCHHLITFRHSTFIFR